MVNRAIRFVTEVCMAIRSIIMVDMATLFIPIGEEYMATLEIIKVATAVITIVVCFTIIIEFKALILVLMHRNP